MSAPARARSERLRGSSTRVYDDAEGNLYPSVTSIIDMMEKPALIPWAAKMSAEYAVLHREALAELPAEDAVTLIKGNWRKRRNKAADFGTLIHDFLDRGVHPNSLPELGYVKQAEDFIHVVGLDVYETEVTVCNPEQGYAGTIDVAASHNGDRIYVDWKTGSGLYESHAMQLVALGEATHRLDEYGGLEPIDLADRGIAVRLAADEYDYKTITRGTDKWIAVWDAFRGLIPVWQWKRDIPKEVWDE